MGVNIKELQGIRPRELKDRSQIWLREWVNCFRSFRTERHELSRLSEFLEFEVKNFLEVMACAQEVCDEEGASIFPSAVITSELEAQRQGIRRWGEITGDFKEIPSSQKAAKKRNQLYECFDRLKLRGVEVEHSACAHPAAAKDESWAKIGEALALLIEAALKEAQPLAVKIEEQRARRWVKLSLSASSASWTTLLSFWKHGTLASCAPLLSHVRPMELLFARECLVKNHVELKSGPHPAQLVANWKIALS